MRRAVISPFSTRPMLISDGTSAYVSDSTHRHIERLALPV